MGNGKKSDKERLNEINTRIAEIDKEIKSLQEEQANLKNQARELNNILSVKELAMSNYATVKESSVICWLDNSVRTTDVMDEFVRSNKRFLLLREVIPVSYLENSCLVVTRKYAGVSYIDSGLTISNLKQDGYATLSRAIDFGLDHVDSNSRFYPLCKELEREKYKELLKEGYLLFSQPIRLGAQTSNNRSGYGSSYIDGKYYQGTLYGETTTFLIIGAVILGAKAKKEVTTEINSEVTTSNEDPYKNYPDEVLPFDF